LPTVFSHAAIAVAAAVAFAPEDVPRRFWLLSVACSTLPDADVIGFALGIPYHHPFGHRGFFHSPFFALLMGTLLTTLFFRDAGVLSRRWLFFLVYFSLLAASHGVLDALTNGGLGVALLCPFSERRFFFGWRPIVVSPIGVDAFFSRWGLAVIRSELLWIWLPSFLMVILSAAVRRRLSL